MDNHRLDLSKEDGVDLENLKDNLTDPFEYESKNVLHFVNFYNRAACSSAPNSPSRCKSPNLPVP